jgi:hypothetical protein
MSDPIKDQTLHLMSLLADAETYLGRAAQQIHQGGVHGQWGVLSTAIESLDLVVEELRKTRSGTVELRNVIRSLTTTPGTDHG